jgi:1,4-alpha-glucan branching enzyme
MVEQALFTELDLFLHGEGTHYKSYDKLGAHLASVDGVAGAWFSVWAPGADHVSVVGSFNGWKAGTHVLSPLGSSGIWSGFVAGVKQSDTYKYKIANPNGHQVEKADPFAFSSEVRPNTASVVWDLGKYEWHDQEWMAHRADEDWHNKPISIYEVHLGSWKRVQEEGGRWHNFRELVESLIPYLKEHEFTHVELMPVAEHPFDGSWGYQVAGYFAPTSRFGTPDDFRYFVDKCHENGIGVILDWVPGHFPKDEHGLGYFDGSHLYEHSDPRQGEHMDWGTLIFNYGRNEVRSFLISNAVFWAEKYHIDGVRVDAVASMLYLDYSREEGQWVPNKYGGRENLEAIDFLKKFNEVVHAEYPGFLTFAEESTAYPKVSFPVYDGGLGFDFKWNMGWMNDTLEYFSKDPIHRCHHQGDLTFSMVYAFSERFVLPFSHDEVVHGKASMLDKMPGDMWQKFANIRLLYSYMYAHPGKKLLFMGGEFGQWNEWNCNESMDWHLLKFEPHKKLLDFVGELNRLYKHESALYSLDNSWQGFEWIDFSDAASSVVSFTRKGATPGDELVCIMNLTPVTRDGYRFGLPQDGHYEVILNSDDVKYGGSGYGVACGEDLDAHHLPWQNRPYSLQLDLPPLGMLFLRKK